MKVQELLEYKNKYYKPVPKKPKARGNKTLWYNEYERWVGDIRTRFPDAQAYYDEENEEIIAACDQCKDSYGKWSKNAKDWKGVTFFRPRSMQNVTHNITNLKPRKGEEKND